jgi:hypothetical protein
VGDEAEFAAVLLDLPSVSYLGGLRRRRGSGGGSEASGDGGEAGGSRRASGGEGAYTGSPLLSADASDSGEEEGAGEEVAESERALKPACGLLESDAARSESDGTAKGAGQERAGEGGGCVTLGPVEEADAVAACAAAAAETAAQRRGVIVAAVARWEASRAEAAAVEAAAESPDRPIAAHGGDWRVSAAPSPFTASTPARPDGALFGTPRGGGGGGGGGVPASVDRPATMGRTAWSVCRIPAVDLYDAGVPSPAALAAAAVAAAAAAGGGMSPRQWMESVARGGGGGRRVSSPRRPSSPLCRAEAAQDGSGLQDRCVRRRRTRALGVYLRRAARLQGPCSPPC